MSTNYYLYDDPCPCCGLGPEPIHVAKSSVGWEVLFQTTSASRSLKELEGEIACGTLKNEYGEEVDPGILRKLAEGSRNLRQQNSDGIIEVFRDPEGFAFTDREFS